VGSGRIYGSCIPVLEVGGTSYWLFALWTNGRIEIVFQYFKNKPPLDSIEIRKMFLRKLNQIPDVNLPEESIEKRPTIPLIVFKKEENLKQLLSAFERLIDAVKNYKKAQ